MNVLVQHLRTRLYLTRKGQWVKLTGKPAEFENAVEAISFCIQRALRDVRLVTNADWPGQERYIYPFGGDPVVKAERKKIRKLVAEHRRLTQQKRMLLTRVDLLRAEAKERKKQFPFVRKPLGPDEQS
jgi:hypothetical protein